MLKKAIMRAMLFGGTAVAALAGGSAFAQVTTAPAGQADVPPDSQVVPVPGPATQIPQTSNSPASQEPSQGLPGDATSATSGDIVVTGIRASLSSSTKAKQNSVIFGDSIFAEDIGKLPATNLAETLERVPGVRIGRDSSGEGVSVAIRGLGSNFTKTVLNNTQIGVASDGSGFSRAADLDLFPSELFTRIDVEKSATASQLEGGTAGVVNLRNARPFDHVGTHVNVIAQGTYGDSSKKFGSRGAIVASTTSDKVGILVGLAGLRQRIRTDGYDNVGYSDGVVPGCTVATGCETTGVSSSNNFVYATTTPDNVGHGLTPGQPLDLTQTSGLSAEQLAAARIPRLGRPNYIFGERSRWNALVSAEFRPSDKLHMALDFLYSFSQRDTRNLSPNWYVRNSGPGDPANPATTGGMVPFDITLDPNNFVTKGTFANSEFFVADTQTKTTTRFYNINPNVTWKPSDNIQLDAQVNYGHSTFYREQPAFNFLTPYESGLEVNYDNTDGNPQPIITTNRNLNDPDLGWRWYRVSLADVDRKTNTKGAHVDLTIGDAENNIKIGGAYDDIYASLQALDNSSAFQTAVCGAICDGKSGLVPNSALEQYLRPFPVSNFGHLAGTDVGLSSFIFDDFKGLKDATNYAQYQATAPVTRGAVTGGSTGTVGEKTWGGYVQGTGVATIAGRDLHVNVGVRYFHTAQTVTGPVQIGSTLETLTADKSYDDFLPSFNVSYDVLRHLKLRVAGSRTITRADLGSVLPGLTFSDPSAQQANAGNPDLKPYTSTNIDLGGEYYTGGIGYIGVDYFRKNIDGFTITQSSTVPFTSLGIDFSSLNATQQAALNQRGGTSATVTLSQPVNLQNLVLNGVEVTWVQPLDFLTKGLGFSANGTHITQSSSSGLFATGVAPWTYNLQGFYEGHGVSVSVNYVWSDKTRTVNPPQNGYNDVSIFSDPRGELDLSVGYDLPFGHKRYRVTFDALNLTNAPLRQTFGYSNQTSSVFYPGSQYLLGLRAKF